VVLKNSKRVEMKDIFETLQALQNTPIPNLLVIAGFIFLLLAFVGRFGAIVELPPNRQMWAGIIGICLLFFGISLFILPNSGSSPTPASSLSTLSLSAENWAGNWKCKIGDYEMDLIISGHGSFSILKGYYPIAYGNQPANEDYVIESITDQDASGGYVYYDTNPNVGCRGKPGVFCGTWSIVFAKDSLELTRIDLATSWHGEYKCARK
jgi:hypothetical protein